MELNKRLEKPGRELCKSPAESGAAAGWDETMRVRCTCHTQSQLGRSWAPLAIVISCLVTLSSSWRLALGFSSLFGACA